MLETHRLCCVFTSLVVTPSHCLNLGLCKGGLGTLHKGEVCKGRQILHPFLGLSQVHLMYIQSTPEVHLKLHCISMSEVRLCTSEVHLSFIREVTKRVTARFTLRPCQSPEVRLTYWLPFFSALTLCPAHCFLSRLAKRQGSCTKLILTPCL